MVVSLRRAICRTVLVAWVCATALSVEATPQDELPPGPPSALQATATDEGIQLTWSAPALNGSAEIESYRVYRSNGSAPEFLAEVASLSYLDADATTENGSFYGYSVTAVNAYGESLPATEAWASYPHCGIVQMSPAPPFVGANPFCLLPPPLPIIGDLPGCPSHATIRDIVCQNPIVQIPP